MSRTTTLAKIGLTSKGMVYVLLGLLAFLSAAGLGNVKNEDTSQSGVLSFVKDITGGTWLLIFLTAGLFCYSLWRLTLVFQKNDNKKIWTRLRYFISALTYFSLAFVGVKLLTSGKESGNSYEENISTLMQQPFGIWLVGVIGGIFICAGFYQIWYGLSEKYKNHIKKLSVHERASKILLFSGKIGYPARGIIYIIISSFIIKAALHHNSNEAGGTQDAFNVIENNAFGQYLLASIGLGLVCYGIFNFVRARYDKF